MTAVESIPAARVPAKGGAAGVVAAGMSRLLQDESSESYATAFKILFRIVVFLTLASVAMNAALVYTVKKGRTGDRFAAMSFDGKKMWLTSLSTPILNTTAMCSWASQAAADVLTFGFDDVNERLARAKPYFTEVGYLSFLAAAHKSGLVKTITKNQQLMTAIPAGPAILGYKGLRQGQYVWDITVPIVMTVRAGEKTQSARPRLVLTIVRVPTIQNSSGLGIQQWIMF